jgi:hypothetical protein
MSRGKDLQSATERESENRATTIGEMLRSGTPAQRTAKSD